MSVGLILVSHSVLLARGVADLAGQMSAGVDIIAVGGTDDGGMGTSFDKVSAAIEQAARGQGAVLLYDLGSSLLTAETALEFADELTARRVLIADAPFVEGAMAAAVAASAGSDVRAVLEAAQSAGSLFGEVTVDAPAPLKTSRFTDTITVANPLGLHARPTGVLVRALAGWDARVTVGRVDGPEVDIRSALRVVALALRGGDEVTVHGYGAQARSALALVVGLIRGGFGETLPVGARIPAPAMGATPPARMANVGSRRIDDQHARLDGDLLTAMPGAPGLAVGTVTRLRRSPLHLPAESIQADHAKDQDPAAELWKLRAAVSVAERKLAAGNEFDAAHAILLADPDLLQAAEQLITSHFAAAAPAWWTVLSERADAFAGDADDLVAARAVDIREAGAAVLAELGVVVDRIPRSLAGAVVFADDLGPGEVPVVLERGAVAVVLSRSSSTSHAVIVARGLGLPIVLRAGDVLARVAPGTMVIVDGHAGTVRINPAEADVADVQSQISALEDEGIRRREAAKDPVVLADGRRISVVANVGSRADARAAVEFGADGIGLLRTELLVLDRETYPDEDTQTADLAELFELMGERPVVVRVLDVGGDKPITALDLDPAHNGFLGVRGLRYLLAHPDRLRTQLRAIFRASVGHRISVLAPMVSVASEVLAFTAAVEAAVISLDSDGVSYQRPDQVGVMVEVPAAALAADEICRVCDFISVGSNDLTAYTMAADRTEPGVAYLIDPASTAVQRLLDQLCAQAVATDTPVAVCGEIAGMAEHVWGLVERGVTELSVAPALIPAVKELLRHPTVS